MNLSIGIVGLPNVGKSTLFNALLKKSVADVANYPFCTIEPNVGIVEVPDDRLPKLAKVVNTTKIVPAVVEFYDIAGLVKGASTGEGLGNKFLSHIREVAAIAHVVRLFEDGNVTHVADKVDPKNDMETIDQELILADLGTLDKQKEPKMNASKEDIATYKVSQKLKEQLDKGVSARNVDLTDDEKIAAKQLNLISMKPVIYVFNVSEKQLENKGEIEKQIQDILNVIASEARQSQWLYLCAKMENDMMTFSDEERAEYLAQFDLKETGLARLAQKAYETLGLISFLTAGEIEARAWTITKDMLAPQAAGVIHTDFEKKFIKAEIANYATFVELGGWSKCRDAGKVTLAGKDYVMQDGDVVDFKIGA